MISYLIKAITEALQMDQDDRKPAYQEKEEVRPSRELRLSQEIRPSREARSPKEVAKKSPLRPRRTAPIAATKSTGRSLKDNIWITFNDQKLNAFYTIPPYNMLPKAQISTAQTFTAEALFVFYYYRRSDHGQLVQDLEDLKACSSKLYLLLFIEDEEGKIPLKEGLVKKIFIARVSYYNNSFNLYYPEQQQKLREFILTEDELYKGENPLPMMFIEQQPTQQIYQPYPDYTYTEPPALANRTSQMNYVRPTPYTATQYTEKRSTSPYRSNIVQSNYQTSYQTTDLYGRNSNNFAIDYSKGNN